MSLRWAVGVLTVATIALVGVVVALAMFVWQVLEAFVPGGIDPFDAWVILRALAPALVVGWLTGLAAAVVLCRGEGLGPRTSGLVAGLIGVTAGTAVFLVSA